MKAHFSQVEGRQLLEGRLSRHMLTRARLRPFERLGHSMQLSKAG